MSDLTSAARSTARTDASKKSIFVLILTLAALAFALFAACAVISDDSSADYYITLMTESSQASGTVDIADPNQFYLTDNSGEDEIHYDEQRQNGEPYHFICDSGNHYIVIYGVRINNTVDSGTYTIKVFNINGYNGATISILDNTVIQWTEITHPTYSFFEVGSLKADDKEIVDFTQDGKKVNAENLNSIAPSVSLTVKWRVKTPTIAVSVPGYNPSEGLTYSTSGLTLSIGNPSDYGGSDIAYQWLKHSNNYSSAESITIFNVADTDTYSLRISIGETSSAIADFNVKIIPKDIASAVVTLKDEGCVYTGQNLTPDVTVVVDGVTLGITDLDIKNYSYLNNSINAGSTITVTIEGKGNYKGTATGTHEVTKATLTVIPNESTVTYGNAPSCEFDLEGFVNDEDDSVLNLSSLQYISSYEQYDDVGDYTISVSGLAADNYQFSYGTGVLHVIPKEITVTITNEEKDEEHHIEKCGGAYEGTIIPATAVFSGLVDGHGTDVIITYSGTANDGTSYSNSSDVPTHAGSFTITVSENSPNYEIEGNYTGTFVVSKKEISKPPTHSDPVKYDGNYHTFLIDKNDLVYTVGQTSFKDVGTHYIECTLVDGNNNQWETRDDILYYDDNPLKIGIPFVINKMPLEVDVIVGDTYFGSEPTFSLQNLHTFELCGNPVFITNYTVGSSVGTYTVSVDFTDENCTLCFDDDNYEVLIEPKEFTVEPCPLEITWVKHGNVDGKYVYDGNNLNHPTVEDYIICDETVTFNVSINNSSIFNKAGTYTFTASSNSENCTVLLNCKTYTVDIEPKPITVESSGNVNPSKIYDGTADWVPTGVYYTLNGIIGGDVVSLSAASAVFNNKNAATGKTVTVSGFSLTGDDASNYSVSTTSFDITGASISKKSITVGPANGISAEKTYDGAVNWTINHNCYTFSGVIENDDVILNGLAVFDNKNVAHENNKVTLSTLSLNGADKDNYELSTSSFTIPGRINPKSVSPTITDTKYTFGAVGEASAGFSSGMLIGEENLAVTLVYNGRANDGTEYTNSSDAPVKAGTYTVTASIDDSNYVLTNNEADFTVNRASRTISFASGSVTKTYGDGSFINLATVSAGDGTITYSTTGQHTSINTSTGEVTIISAGRDTITATVPETADYEGATNTYVITVEKKAVTITLTPNGGIYGGTITAATATCEGLVGSDSITITYTGTSYDGSVTYDSSDVPMKAGEYTVEAILSENYSYYETKADFIVSKKPLTITADSDTRTYNGTALTKNTYTHGNLASGDALESVTVTGSITYVHQNSENNNVPSAAVIRNSGNIVTPNYEITYVPGTLKIDPASVEITSGSAEKTYDGTALTEETYTVTSGQFFSGDVVTVSDYASRTYVSDPSENTFLVSVDHSGTDVTSSYTITHVNGVLTVNPKEISLTWSTSPVTYDGNEHAFTATTTDILDGDKSYVSLAFGNNIAKNVSTGNATASLTGDTGDRASSYSIKDTDSTYSWEISKRPVTVTITATDGVYGTAFTPATYEMSEIIEGDTVNVTLTYTGVDYSSTVIPTKAGTYTVTASIDNSNYSLVSEPKQFVIAPMPITITANSNHKTYDGTPLTDSGYTCDKELPYGDEIYSVNVVGSITYYASITNNNVASAAVIKKGDIDVTPNYSITYAPGTLSIDKREITFLSGSAEKIYDGTALIKHEYSITAGSLVSGDVCTETYTGSTVNAVTVDNTFTVTIKNSGETDITSSYAITYQYGTLKVNQKEIGLSWKENTPVYNGEIRKPTAKATGLIGSDTCTVEVFAEGKYVGTYTATAVSLSNSNYKLPLEVTTEYTISVLGTVVTSASASKEYDGTPLINHNYTPGQLGTGDRFVVEITGTITDYVEDPTGNNTIASVKVFDSENNDVTNCYNITKIPGTLTITRVDLTLTWDADSKEYNGEEQYFTATFDGVIEADKDDELLYLEYENNHSKNVANGTATAILAGTKAVNYVIASGAQHDWEITPKTLTPEMISIDSTHVYSGSQQTVTFSVSDGTILTENDWELVSGDKGTNAGDYTLTILAKNNYAAPNENKVTKTWTIQKKDISSDVTMILGDDFGYDTTEHQMTISSVKYKVSDEQELSLASGTDYTIVSGNKGTNAGTYTLTIQGVGNYTGMLSEDWEIISKDISSDVTMTLDGNSLVYTGEEQTKTITSVMWGEIPLVLNTDYVIDSGNKGTNAYTYSLKIQGVGNYTGYLTAGWSIAKKDATVVWTHEDSYTYTGVVQTGPSAKFVDVHGEDVELTPVEDSGKTFKNADTYNFSVDVSSYTNYNITNTTLQLEIGKAVREVDWTSAVSYTYTGAVQTKPVAKISVFESADPIAITVSEKDGKEFKDAGSYVFIASYDNANYQLDDDSKSLPVTIEKKIVSVEWLIKSTGYTYTGAVQRSPTAYFDGVGSDGSIDLDVSVSPETFKDAGNYTFTASTDNNNYELDDTKILNVEMKKASINVVWNPDQSYTFTGTEHPYPAASATGVGTDGAIVLNITIKTGETKFLNAGSYTFTAATENTNYTLTNTDCTVRIDPCPVDVNWHCLESYVYKGTAYDNPTADYEDVTHVVQGLTVNLEPGKTFRDVGEYTFTAVCSDGNYTLNNPTKKLNITKLTVSVEWDVGEYTYDGSVQELAATAKIKKAGSEEYLDLDVDFTSEEDFKDAGEYGLIASTDDPNYVLTNETATAVIDPYEIDAVWTAGGPYTYTGYEQTSKPTAKITRLSGEGDLDLTVTPDRLFKDAGYYSFHAISGDKNYFATNSDLSDVEIKALEIEVVWDYESNVIDYAGVEIENLPTASITGVGEDGKIDLTVVEKDRKTLRNVDQYTYVASTDNTNYDLKSKELPIDIIKVDATVNWDIPEYRYNGNVQVLPTADITGVGEDGTIVLDVKLLEGKTFRNADDYLVQADYKASTIYKNYNLKTDTHAVTILKLEKQVQWEGIDDLTYDGTTRSIPTAYIVGEGTDPVRIDLTVNEMHSKTFKDADTYQFKAAPIPNYDFTEDEKSVTILPYELTPVWKNVQDSYTYNGNVQTSPTASAMNPFDEETINLTVTCDKSEFKDAGQYRFKASTDGNFKVKDSKEYKNLTIEQLNISGATIVLGDSPVYNAAEQTQQIVSVTKNDIPVTYTVTGDKATHRSTEHYTLTVTGTGNFTGTETAEWNIVKAVLTPVLDISGVVSKIFDNTDSINGTAVVTLDGEQGDDEPELKSVSYALASKNAGTRTVNATGLVLDDQWTLDYELSVDAVSETAEFDLVIKKDITLNISNKTQDYDGNVFIYTIAKTDLYGMLGNLTAGKISTVDSAVRFYTVKDTDWIFTEDIDTDSGIDNYNIAIGSVSLQICNKTVTVKADDASKTYDGTPLTCDTWRITGGSLITGDTLTVTVEGTITDVGQVNNAITGYVIKNSSGDDVTSNYGVSTYPGILKVTKKNLTISVDETLVFNGSAQTVTYTDMTANGSVAGDSLTAGSIITRGYAVNTYTVKDTDWEITEAIQTAKGITNYNVSYSVSIEIEKRDLSIVIERSSVYNGELFEYTVVNADAIGIADNDNITAGKFKTAGKSVKTYTGAGEWTQTEDIATELGIDNYDVTVTSVSLTISKRVLEVSPDEGWTKVYDGTVGFTSFTITNKVEGDTVSLLASFNKNDITATAIMFLFDEANDNYLAPESVTATITPKPITVTVDSEHVYDTELFEYTLIETDMVELADGDELTAGKLITMSLEVGIYTVKDTDWEISEAIQTKNGIQNYSLSYNVKLEISPADITDVSVTGYSSVYDCSEHDAVADRQATTVDGSDVTWRFSSDGETWAETIIVKFVASSGTYYYEASAANHKTATGEFTVSITKAIVPDPSASDFGSAVFDHTLHTSPITDNDDYTVTQNEGGINAGTYDVELTLRDPSNYKWNDVDTAAKTFNAFVIEQAPLTVTLASGRFEYTGYQIERSLTSEDLSGLVPGDSMQSGIVKSVSKDVGTYSGNTGIIPVIVTDYGIENYSITCNVTITIYEANIRDARVTGYDAQYDGEFHNAVASYTATTVDGCDTIIEVSLNGTDYMPEYLVKDSISLSMYYRISAPNHNPTIGGFSVRVSKVVIPDPDQSVFGTKIYNGETQISDITDTDDYTVTKNDGGKYVGTYDVELTLIHPENYRWNDVDTAAKTFVGAFRITYSVLKLKVHDTAVFNGQKFAVPITDDNVVSGLTEGDRITGGTIRTTGINATVYGEHGWEEYVKITTLMGIENYTLEMDVRLEITPKDMHVKVISTGEYTSQVVKSKIKDISSLDMVPGDRFNAGEFTTAGADVGVYTDEDEWTMTVPVNCDFGISNYNILDYSVSITITERDITNNTTIDISGHELTYNGSEQTQLVTSVSNAGIIVDTYELQDNKVTNHGTYLMKVIGTGNFKGTALKQFTVNQANINNVDVELTSSMVYTADYIYPTVKLTFNGLTLVENVDYISSPSPAKEAGQSATVVLTGYRDSNYRGTITKYYTVEKAPLTVTLEDETISYGEAPYPVNYTFSGFKGDDTEDVVYGTPAYYYGYRQYGNVGTYTIWMSGLDAINYRMVYKNSHLTVNAIPITVIITPNGGYYGNVTPAEAEFHGLIHDDPVIPGYMYDGTAKDGTTYSGQEPPYKAGTYTVTVSKTGAKAVNYYFDGEYIAPFIIDKAGVSEPDAGTVTYTGEHQKSSLVTTEIYTVDENEGRITAGTADVKLSLIDFYNYTWESSEEVQVTLQFTVAKKDLSVIANDNTITFGDEPAGNGAIFGGFVHGEDESVILGTLGYDFDYEQYDDAGSYSITPKGLYAENYECIFTDGTLYVVPLSREVSWSDTYERVYAGVIFSNPKAKITAIGPDGEYDMSVDVTCNEGDFRNAGDYTFTASTTNINYTLTNTSAAATILKCSIAVNWETEKSAVYKGEVYSDPVASIAGVGLDGKIMLTVTKITEADYRNAGEYLFSASTDNTNYELKEETVQETYTITKRPVDAAWSVKAGGYDYSGYLQERPSATIIGVGTDPTYILVVTIVEGKENFRDAGDYKFGANFPGEPSSLNYTLNNPQITVSIRPYSTTAIWSPIPTLSYTAEVQTFPTARIQGIGEDRYDTLNLEVTEKDGRTFKDASTYTFVATNIYTNYNVTQAEIDVTIHPCNIDCEWELEPSYIYSGTVKEIPKASFTGLGTDGVIVLTVSEDDSKEFRNADDYNFTAVNVNTNYNLQKGQKAITIESYSTTVNWKKASSDIYSGEVKEMPEGTIAGIGDDPEIIHVIVTERSGKIFRDVDTYLFKSSLENNNYKLGNSTIGLSIDPYQTDVIWPDTSYTYEGKIFSTPVSYIEGVGTDGQILVTVSEKDGKTFRNFGDYTFTASLDNINYSIRNIQKVYSVAKAEVSAVWTSYDYVYDGTVRDLPVATVIGLGDDEDFDIPVRERSGKVYMNAGNYSFIAENDNDNYTVSDIEKDLTIERFKIESIPDQVKDFDADITYIEFEFSGVLDEFILMRYTAFDVSMGEYLYSTEPAEGCFTVMLKNHEVWIADNYVISETVEAGTFTITPIDINKVASQIDTVVYNTEYQTPEPILILNGHVLQKGVDYTFTDTDYWNNRNAGTALLTVTGLGSLYGKMGIRFTIEPYPVVLESYSVKYSGMTMFIRDYQTDLFEDISILYRTYSKDVGAFNYDDELSSGKYTMVLADGEDKASNYAIDKTDIRPFFISHAEITSIKSVTREYNALSIYKSLTDTGVNDEIINMEYTAYTKDVSTSIYSETAKTGCYTVRLLDYGQFKASNYKINLTDAGQAGLFTITPAVLTIPSQSMSYNGVSGMKIADITTYMGETIKLRYEATSYLAGEYHYGAGQDGYSVDLSNGTGKTSNYILSEENPGVFTIEKVKLTAKFVDESITCKDTPELQILVTGFVNDETEDIAKGYRSPFIEFTGHGHGTYEITPQGGTAYNYYFEYVSGTLTISHSLVRVGDNAATKSIAHYMCEGCERSFFDTEATMEYIYTLDAVSISKEIDSDTVDSETAAEMYEKIREIVRANPYAVITEQFIMKGGDFTIASKDLQTSVGYIDVFKVTSDDGISVGFSKEALQGIDLEEGDFDLSIQTLSNYEGKYTSLINDTGVVTEFLLKVDLRTISKFDGNITLTVPYEIAEGQDPSNIHAYYLGADESERTECKYVDGNAEIVTTHFSPYLIVYEEPVPEEHNFIPYIAGAAAIFLIIGIIVIRRGRM